MNSFILYVIHVYYLTSSILNKRAHFLAAEITILLVSITKKFKDKNMVWRELELTYTSDKIECIIEFECYEGNEEI